MDSVLIVGGTRFIGRDLVEEFLAAEYDVTLFNHGRHPNPFADRDGVEHVMGDRKSSAAIDEAADAVEPDVVVDCVPYFPGEVEMATRVLSDVEVVTTSARELARGNLQPDDFPLYNPTPYVLSTEKLASLG